MKSPSSAQTLVLCKHCSATSESGHAATSSVLVANLKHGTVEDAMKKAHSIPFTLRTVGSAAHTKARDMGLTDVALSGQGIG